MDEEQQTEPEMVTVEELEGRTFKLFNVTQELGPAISSCGFTA